MFSGVCCDGGWLGWNNKSITKPPTPGPSHFPWIDVYQPIESLLLISRVLGKFIWTIFVSILICFLNGEMDVQRSFLCCSTNRRSLELISHIVCFSQRSNEVHGVSFYSLTIFIFPITKCLLKPFFPFEGIELFAFLNWFPQVFIYYDYRSFELCVFVYNHTFSQSICLVVFFNVTMVGRYLIVSGCLSWLLLLGFVMMSMSFSKKCMVLFYFISVWKFVF